MADYLDQDDDNVSVIDKDLDIVSSNYICINAKQGDGLPRSDNASTRYIRFTIYDQGRRVKLTDKFKSIVRYKKPDGHGVMIYNEIDEQGRIVVTLTHQMLVVAGMAHGDLTIEVGDTVISSMPFLVNIVGKPITDEDIESSDEYKVLVLSAEEAKKWALISKSYAVGDTGIRDGEDTDNSKYYWSLFKKSNNAALWIGTKAEYLNERKNIKDKTLVILTDVAGAVGPIDGTTSLATLRKPTLRYTSYAYDKKSHTAELSNFDITKMVKTGEAAVDVGTYYVQIDIKDPYSYMWEDGTADPVILTWKITKKSLTKPTLYSSSVIWSGEVQTPRINYYDDETMSKTGETQGQNVGTYSFTVSLRDPFNYKWNDNTTDSFPLSWKIDPVKLSIPYVSGSYTWTGESQTPSITNYTSSTYKSKMYVTGELNGRDAKTYNFSIGLIDTDNYVWDDGTTDPIDLTWTINKLRLSKPTKQEDYEYTGIIIVPTLNYDNPLYINKDGVTEATEPNQYKMIVSLKDTNNMMWSDNTTAPFNIYWQITLAKISKPSITNKEFIYDGDYHRPTYQNFDPTIIDCEGHMEAIEADTYDLVFKIHDPQHYTWSDGTGSAYVQTQWQIKPLQIPEAKLKIESFTYNASDTTPYSPLPIVGWNPDIMKLNQTESTTSATAIGNYYVVIDFKDPKNYIWKDNGSNNPLRLHWEVK